MAEYIEREAAFEDFEKCNSKNPKWTPSRVKTLIARQKQPMLPRCGMGSGAGRGGSGLVLYVVRMWNLRKHLAQVIGNTSQTAAQRWTVNNKISPPFPGGDLFAHIIFYFLGCRTVWAEFGRI